VTGAGGLPGRDPGNHVNVPESQGLQVGKAQTSPRQRGRAECMTPLVPVEARVGELPDPDTVKDYADKALRSLV